MYRIYYFEARASRFCLLEGNYFNKEIWEQERKGSRKKKIITKKEKKKMKKEKKRRKK